MKRSLLFGLVLMCLMAVPVAAKKNAQPQNIDFGSYTCKEFLEEVAGADAESTGFILMWLDGYLSGVSGDNVLNWKNMDAFTDKFLNYCTANPKANMLAAAKKVGIAR